VRFSSRSGAGAETSSCIASTIPEEEDHMGFTKFAGMAAAAILLAATAQAAPLTPAPIGGAPAKQQIVPAVTTAKEVGQLKPQQVRWGHHGWHHHGGWHHRHWGWHHRHWGWHHRHWGWHHRHWGWHHRHWHHRHWGWHHHRHW
jgi:hypothetical protein